MATTTKAVPALPSSGSGAFDADERSSIPWEQIAQWMGLLVVVACCTFVFVQLHPGLVFKNTTPSGGDTAAHVWWPAYLRDHLLPWRIAGWSPDFYAGFPAGQF